MSILKINFELSRLFYCQGYNSAKSLKRSKSDRRILIAHNNRFASTSVLERLCDLCTCMVKFTSRQPIKHSIFVF